MLRMIWWLQVLAEGAAVAALLWLNMIPEKYMMVLGGGLLLLTLFTGMLMLPRRISPLGSGFGVFISFLIFLLSCGVTLLAMDTMGRVSSTTGHGSGQLVQAVYVRTDDPAQNLADTAGYRFAVIAGYGVDDAVASVEKELGGDITITEYDGPTALLDAFFGGREDALILNSAYVRLLEELDGYADFSSRVRALYETTGDAWKSGLLDAVGGLFEGQNEKSSITKDPFVIYFSGSDTRNKKLATSRSDVNILMVVNPKTKQILLLNTPRDYYIPNPQSSSGQRDKLTHCGIYGIECSMEALSTLYGVEVPYYAQINFTGFETLIDAIGGVTVYCDKSFTASNGVRFSAGEIELDGVNALTFARERYNLAGGDNARGQNQMKVIKAVVQKMTSGTTLLSNYGDIMESLEGMFATSLTGDDISKLVKMQLNDLAQWNIQSYAVTGKNGKEITYSMPGTKLSVMYPDEGMVAYGSQLIQKVLSGETLTEADMTYHK